MTIIWFIWQNGSRYISPLIQFFSLTLSFFTSGLIKPEREKKISTNEMFLNLFATIDFVMWFWPLLRALDVVISRVRSSTGTKRNTTERKATDLLNRAELSNAKHCFDRVVKSRSQQTVSNYINLNDVENNINGTTKKNYIYLYEMFCSWKKKWITAT